VTPSALPSRFSFPTAPAWNSFEPFLDYRDRGVTFVSRLDEDDFLFDVMERVRAFIDPDSGLIIRS